MTSPLTFAASDLTIHRIVQASGPFIDIRQMLPGLTGEGLAPDSLSEDGDSNECVSVV
jgi:hypothetical protein